ncbi:MAG: nucleotidyltransferase protein [Ignavibacteria bacterium]|nr:nucleotidyltransferase protein [Ignavibacteria bacterium]
MLNRETAIEKVRAFASELSLNGINLDKVILFGSYSINQQKENSDIDVALVSDMFSGFGFEDRKLFSRVNIKKEYIDIETKTYHTKYFIKSDPFIEEIKRTGIEII